MRVIIWYIFIKCSSFYRTIQSERTASRCVTSLIRLTALWIKNTSVTTVHLHCLWNLLQVGRIKTELIFVFIHLSDYMNKYLNETSPNSRLSEILNPNYEDQSQVWADTTFSSLLKNTKPTVQVPEDPKYLNTTQIILPLASTENLISTNCEAAFLPHATPSTANTAVSPGNRLFLPAAENLEYLGVGAIR